MVSELFRLVALDEAEIPNLVSDGAAQDPVQRLPGGLANGIPECQLDSGHGLGEIAWRAAGAPRIEADTVVVGDGPVAIINRLADKMRDRILDDRVHWLDGRTSDRLADPGGALVSLDLDQDYRRGPIDPLGPVIGLLKLAQQRRSTDLRDLHDLGPLHSSGGRAELTSRRPSCRHRSGIRRACGRPRCIS